MRSLWRMWPLVLVVGCEPEQPEDEVVPGDTYFADGGFLLDGTHVNVLRSYGFSGELSPGVAYGFDLDDQVSPDGDASSCGHGDHVGPDGESGIDNRFAPVWDIIQPLVGDAVEGLLQGAIQEGRFLLMLELGDVDDLMDDEDVSLRIFRGRGRPVVGTQDLLAPDQTFYVDPSVPVSTVEGIAIRDGHLEAGPVAFQIPIDILEANFLMDVQGGRISLDIAEDGTFSGVLGGSFSVGAVIDQLLATDANAEAALVQPIFEANADMDLQDGVCDGFSVAFAFTGTTAFVVRYPD